MSAVECWSHARAHAEYMACGVMRDPLCPDLDLCDGCREVVRENDLTEHPEVRGILLCPDCLEDLETEEAEEGA